MNNEKINSDINARISGKVSFVPIDSTNCVCRKIRKTGDR